MADSIFFHANDINSEVYNYAWKIYQERKEKKEKLKAVKNKANGKSKNGDQAN